MESRINTCELNYSIVEIANEDLQLISGGGFGYDFGFFIREMVIYVANGGQQTGLWAVGMDLSFNYHSIN